jgi:hypothetical protein
MKGILSIQNLEIYAKIATILGWITAVVSLLYTAWQAKKNTQTNQARFWLELRRMFLDYHNDVHSNLLEGQPWHGSDTSPTDEDMPKVINYMGLFEHCKLMLDDGLIDWKVFAGIYAYRIDNILSNNKIVRSQLSPGARREEGWKDFCALVNKLKKENKLRYALPE